ncbi:MAG: putative DNA-binding regulatory protein, partial [Myxococcaceae bacterium]|nr:putative DNA-binding regulatory protein [Myxococcaceae bacterium]
PAHGAEYGKLPGLEGLLEALVARARLAWPALELPAPRFLAHLAARLPPTRHPQRTLEELAAEDLYLACCCAGGDPKALAALEATQLPAVARAVASLDTTGVLADEVQQVLRERLLLKRENGGPPRIADYAGQGPLRAWLKAAAIRHALNLKRPGHREEALDQERLTALPLAAPNPELELIRRKHKQHFATAFAAALATLSPRERTLLKLHTLDGLPLDQIAPLYQKDKSTISRWLAKAQQQLHEETRAQLVAALKLTPHELESVLRAAQSELSLSLSRLLDD